MYPNVVIDEDNGVGLFESFFYGFPWSVEKPEGCDLVPMTWKMYKMIWMINRDLGPRLLKLVESFKGKKDVFHIKSPKELRAFTLEQR